MKFWFSMFIRMSLTASAAVALYLAITQQPLTPVMVWLGCAWAFYSAAVLERVEQVKRGEVDD